MPLNFLPPEESSRYNSSGTVFLLDRLPTSVIETIRRSCYEEGKQGVARFMFNQDLFQEKLIDRALRGWENYRLMKRIEGDKLVDGGEFAYNDQNRASFIKFCDGNLRAELATFIENPSQISAIFVEEEKKDSGSGAKPA